MSDSVTSYLIFNLLRYRSEYESMIRGDNQVEQNRFANIIVNKMWLLERIFAGIGKDRFTIPRKEVNRKYRDMVDAGVHTHFFRISEMEQVVLRVEATQWSLWLLGLSLRT